MTSGNLKSKCFRFICNKCLEKTWIYKIARLFLKQINIYPISTLYKYAHDNGLILKYISDDTEREYDVSSMNADDNKIHGGVIKRACSRQYITVLNNVTVRSDTDGLICDGQYLTDKIEFDEKGFVEHLPGRTMVKDGNILIWQNEKRVVDKAVFMIKMWSYNYFHFVMEGMSRLGSIEEFDAYRDWPLIIDECVMTDSRNIDLINLLNVNNRKIIWIRNGECIRVNKLLVPAVMSWAIWDIDVSVKKGWGYVIAKEAGEYLRKTVLSRYQPQKQYNCVYVARGNNNRLINESQIIKEFESAGFEIFYPEKATLFQEEVDCFATANCIVLCSGGASTNLVFCKKNVDIFCIVPHKFRNDTPQDITSTVGITVNLRDAVMKEDNGLLMMSRFAFPIEKCGEIVEHCKAKGWL